MFKWVTKAKKTLNINIVKTLLVNYRVVGIRKMLKLPILVYKNTDIDLAPHSIKLMCGLSFGLVRIGLYKENLYAKKKDETKFSVRGEIEIKGRTHFYSGCRIIVLEKGKLSLGKDFEIGSDSAIVVSKSVSIGMNCMISWDALIMDTDLHPICDSGNNRTNSQRDVCIGDNVWICCRCVILKGIKIPNGTIVSAASVITKSECFENSIISSRGVIKKGICWSRNVIP